LLSSFALTVTDGLDFSGHGLIPGELDQPWLRPHLRPTTLHEHLLVRPPSHPVFIPPELTFLPFLRLGWNTYLASANAAGNLAPAEIDLDQKITDRDVSTVAAEAL
jgi:hypothetical protein